MATLSSNPSSVVSAGAWLTTTNVYTSNDVYATNTGATQNTEYPLDVGGFDFSAIPAGSTINAVYVYVEAKASSASRSSIRAELYDGTTLLTGSLALTPLTTADVTRNFTPTVTLAQLQSANLKIRIINKRTASQACTTSVDYAYIYVDYSAPLPPVEQKAYRLYDMSNTEADVPAMAPQNTPYAKNDDFGSTYGSIRFLVQSGGTTIPSTTDWQLQYDKNGNNVWVNPTTSSSDAFWAVQSGNITHGSGVATNRLTGGTGSWVAGKVSGTGVVTDYGLAANSYTELLYTVGVGGTAAQMDDVYRFRIVATGITFTYTQYATYTFYGTKYIYPHTFRIYKEGTESASVAVGVNEQDDAVLPIGPINFQLRVALYANFPLANNSIYLKMDDGSNQDIYQRVTTTPFRGISAVNSASLTDGAAITTQRLTQYPPSGKTFVGNGKISETGTVSGLTATTSQHVEVLFSLRADSDVLTGEERGFHFGTDDVGVKVFDSEQNTLFDIGFAGTMGIANHRWGVDDPSETYIYHDPYPYGVLVMKPGDPGVILRMCVALVDQPTAIPTTADWQLQYEKNASGTWIDMTVATPDIQSFNSANWVDGATVPWLLGTYLYLTSFTTNGKVSEDGLIDDMGAADWVGSGKFEMAYTVKVPATTSFVQNDVIRFRVLYNGTPLPFHTNQAGSSSGPFLMQPKIRITYPTISQGNYGFISINSPVNTQPDLVKSYSAYYNPLSSDIQFQLFMHVVNDWADAPSQNWQLQYEKNSSGTWVDVTTGSTGVTAINASNLTDGAAITAQLLDTIGAGSFVAGKVSEDGLVDGIALAKEKYTAFLFPLQMTAASFTAGDVVRFRAMGSYTPQTYPTTEYPTVVVAAPPAIALAAYRFENIDGTEAGAAPLAAQDTPVSLNVFAGDQSYRLRVLLQNTTGTEVQSVDDWLFRYRVNSGAWLTTTGGSGTYAVSPTGGAALGNPTTNRLTGGTGTFAPGRIVNNASFMNSIPNQGIPAYGFTEIVMTLRASKADLKEGDVVSIRLAHNEFASDVSYPVTPTINIIESEQQDLRLTNFRFYADGTESGSTELAVQNAAHTVDLASGDKVVHLRAMMQSQYAVAVDPTSDFLLQADRNGSNTWVSAGYVSNWEDVLYGTASLQSANMAGQSFMGNGGHLLSASFWVSKYGTPTVGTLTARLYAFTGVFGTSAQATGSVLATSTNSFPVSGLPLAGDWYTWTFDGTYTLVAGTPYYLAVYVDTTSGSNYPTPGYAQSTGHPGSASYSYGVGNWSNISGDLLHKFITDKDMLYDSSSITEGEATTNRLTGGSGSFVAGKASEVGRAQDVGITAFNYTELLYVLRLKQAGFAAGESYRFRIQHNGSSYFVTPTQYPTITIAGGSTLAPVSASDPVGLTDSFTTEVATPLTYDAQDAIGLTDAASNATALARSDVTGLVDTRSLASNLNRSDVTGLVDTRALAPALDRSDVTGLVDTRALAPDLNRTDVTGLVDTRNLATDLSRSDVIGLVDTNVPVHTPGGTVITRDYTDSVLPAFNGEYVTVPLAGQVFDHYDPRWELSSDATWAPDAYRITQDWGSIEVATYRIRSAVSLGTRLFSKVSFESAPTGTDCWGEFTVNTPNDRFMMGATDNKLWAEDAEVGTYDPVAHAWLGFRFEADGVHYETSPDGSTWTQVYYEADSVARPLQWSVVPYWEFGGTDPNTMYIYSFNGFPLSVQDVAGLLDTSSAGIVGASVTGRPKAYTGTAFAEKPGMVWTGSAWVEKPWKKWTGTEWETLGGSGLAPSTETKLIAQYHGDMNTSFTVPMTATTPGRALLAIGLSAATITMPAGWTESRIYYSVTHLAIWRLDPSLHTTSLTSVAVGLAAARQLSMVIVEDDIFGLSYVNDLGPKINNVSWWTDEQTLGIPHGLVYLALFEPNGVLDVGMSSYDRGFTALADTGNATGMNAPYMDEGVRLYVGENHDTSLSSQPVNITLVSPGEGTDGAGNNAGIVTWSRVPTTAGTTASLFSDSQIAYDHTAADGSAVTVGTEFSVASPAKLTAIRFLMPTSAAYNYDVRQCALYAVGSGALMAGPFTMPTPTTPGEWVTYTLTSAYNLSVGSRYRVGVFHPQGYYCYYPGGHYFDTTGPGATTTLINGFLTRYASVDSSAQGSYHYSGTIGYPDGAFNAGCYFADVIVETT